MKIIATIMSMFVDGNTPPGSASFIVQFTVSTGALSSSAVIHANISLNESQIEQSIKQDVATLVNQALSTSLGVSDVRLL